MPLYLYFHALSEHQLALEQGGLVIYRAKLTLYKRQLYYIYPLAPLFPPPLPYIYIYLSALSLYI